MPHETMALAAAAVAPSAASAQPCWHAYSKLGQLTPCGIQVSPVRESWRRLPATTGGAAVAEVAEPAATCAACAGGRAPRASAAATTSAASIRHDPERALIALTPSIGLPSG